MTKEHVHKNRGTNLERRVVRLDRLGHSQRYIAKHLGIGRATVAATLKRESSTT